MGDDPEERLARLRAQVAETDRRLVEAMNARLLRVREIKAHKQAHGLPLLDPGREAWLLAHLGEANAGPLSDEGLERLVTTVLELTKDELALPTLHNQRAGVGISA